MRQRTEMGVRLDLERQNGELRMYKQHVSKAEEEVQTLRVQVRLLRAIREEMMLDMCLMKLGLILARHESEQMQCEVKKIKT